jgi:hypothetical protein
MADVANSNRRLALQLLQLTSRSKQQNAKVLQLLQKHQMPQVSYYL